MLIKENEHYPLPVHTGLNDLDNDEVSVSNDRGQVDQNPLPRI